MLIPVTIILSTVLTLAPVPASAGKPVWKGGFPWPNAYYPGYADQSTIAGAQFGQKSPPSYPSPWMDGSGGWADAYSKAQAFVRQLTLTEKVNLTTGVSWEGERCVGQNGGIPRIGFRSMCMQDSPLGVRDTDYNSVFPAGGTIAATWDRGLMYKRGFDMGSEHRDKGVDVQLGPVVGPIGRAPEGGRNWEGFSPDPYLSGVAVAETVRGIQSAGVIACTKHFIGNEQEHFRQAPEAQNYGFDINESASSNIDDTTMHELYLWPFADAVRAGTGSVMCSYNQVNNSYSCANSYLLNHLLKGELGFQGFVMSDWSAQHSGVSSALAGLDMTMPGDTTFDSGESYWGANLTIAVLNGTVPEWRIDDMATRIIAAWYYAERDTHAVPINFDSWTTDTYGPVHYYANEGQQKINSHVDVRGKHGIDIRHMAAKATVLLKNAKGVLPLGTSEKFTAVFGNDAGANPFGPNGCSDRGCDNGTLGIGWGSGTANYPYLVTPLQAIENEVMRHGDGIVQGITENFFAMPQVEALASQASVSLVFVNADSGEGYIDVDGNEGDRNNLTAWLNGNDLIQTVAGNCKNTIVVVHATGPIEMTRWYDNDNITAILWAGTPGQESGNSIADVLYGRVNPGAKLPFTLGRNRQDYGTDLLYRPNNGKNAPQIDFAEGVFIDYRAFDAHPNTSPIYPFGYGLSYTTFAFSNLVVTPHPAGPYTPTTGTTASAPSLGTPGSAAAYGFPRAFHKVKAYIYPYLSNTSSLAASSGDPHYAAPGYSFPAGAHNSNPQPRPAAGGAPGGNPQLYDALFTVSCTVSNTGSVAGDEVPQLYVSLGAPSDPVRVLRGFDRLSIAAGGSATFTTVLTRRDLSNWNVEMQDWVVTKYAKTVYVGNSSRNLPLNASLDVSSYQ